MAPAMVQGVAADVLPSKSSIRDNNNAPKHIFPDGIRTSGQHNPLYDQLKPYSAFPKEIIGPTAWKEEDYANNPERWTHPFSEEEVAEIENATEAFIASGTPLTGITKELFPLPKMAAFLESLRKELINGKGFILFKNFPANKWDLHKSAVAYMGLGSYLGNFVSQNGRGHVLGHVKDLGEDPSRPDKVRMYRTNARQFFHSDDCDVVGLLCLARALEGGESDLCSSHQVFNTLQRERPDIAELLTQPIWYFDRKGEVSQGQDHFTRQPVFYLERAADGMESRVYTKWDPYYVRSLTRFSDKGVIPPLSDKQKEAAEVLEEVCNRLALHMILEVGDIQFLSNMHVLHARTAYQDHAPPTPRRHLMRLWLAAPESEDGWRLPFHDSKEKKRGGVQVDDRAPNAPDDAE